MADYRIWLVKPDGSKRLAGGVDKYEESVTADNVKEMYEQFFAGTGITVEVEVLPE